MTERTNENLTMLAMSSALIVFIVSCGGLAASAPTVVRGTLGGMYAACQTVDSDDATWRRICDGVERSLPALDQLGAGPADLPADVASREVTITIADGQ